MAVPAVTIDFQKPGRLGNSAFGVIGGQVNISSYDTTYPPITAITGMFTRNLRVVCSGISSNGYTVRWGEGISTFKAYEPGAVTVTRGAPPAASAITVGASPFTYTNNDGVPELVTITGGTTSHINVTRGAFTSADLATTDPYAILLFPGDAVNVTYSAAPTMEKLPDGAITASVAAGETEVPNGTNVGTVDFIATGQVF